MTRELIERLRSKAGVRHGRPAVLAPHREPLMHEALPEVVTRIATLLPAGILVATVLPSGPDAILVVLAAMQGGAVLPLNPEASEAELSSAFDRLRPGLVVTVQGLPTDAAAIARAKGIAVAFVSAGPTIGLLTLKLDGNLPAASNALPHGTRLLLQTSGTTAAPKVVPLTEANLIAAAEALSRSLQLGPEDRALNLMPQFHIGGMWDLVAPVLLSGGGVICGGNFSRQAFAEGMTLAPTWVQLAPPMIADLVADPKQGPLCLRFIRSVSAPLPADLRRVAESRLRVPLVEIYGMTETAGVITSQPLDRQDGSVGRSTGMTVTIRDGEIFVQGPQVAPGYLLAEPDEHARFGVDGFRTGDLGRVDSAGHLWITGRSKDIINRGGEMVAPAEVEAALRGLSWVLDAAAFAIPHPTLGEDIAAAIVVSGGPQDAPEAARRAVRELLGYGRMPAAVHVVDALPYSPSGKLLRSLLAERFAAKTAAPAGSVAAPLTPLGDWVAAIWSQVLGHPGLLGGDDFFLHGGTSLQAAQAVALMQECAPDALLYVSSVYDGPTPATYERFLRDRHPDLCAAILRDRVLTPAPVTPVTEDTLRVFNAALRCPAPPVRTGPPNDRAAFILSAPRSGSTLLRVMMAGHPALFAPPELYLLSHRDLATRQSWFGRAHASQLEGLPRCLMAATGMDADAAVAAVSAAEAAAHPVGEVYREIQALVSPRILVDKTPFYGVHPETLAATEALFPDAIYIHLTRHPYGVIRSFEKARLDQLWWPRLTGPSGPPSPFHPRQLAEMLWTQIATTTSAFLQGIPVHRQLHLRYESLVADPQTAMEDICRILDIAFNPNLLSPKGSEAQRMTDGLRDGSRMIGDPNFHRHTGLSQSSAEAWRADITSDFLSDRTWAEAIRLGHAERIDDAGDRLCFEL